MPAILVDADACPVKDEIYKVAFRHEIAVTIVSNSPIRVPDHPLIARSLVGAAFDAADDWIAERAHGGVIVVTDGQAADPPPDPARLRDLGPAHILIVGDPERRDRRAERVVDVVQQHPAAAVTEAEVPRGLRKRADRCDALPIDGDRRTGQDAGVAEFFPATGARRSTTQAPATPAAS